MSRPFLAAIGFTASRICACGPGVAPMRTVCVCWARAGSAASESRAARLKCFRDIGLLLVRCFWLESGVADAFVEVACKAVADALHRLDENDENDHHGEHHLGHEALV